MPLKIRCPHCLRVLVAANETAGLTKLCPACKQTFNVPIPPRVVREPAPSQPPQHRCPRCANELAPAVTYCPICHTDLQTGRRLPWRRRLRLMGGRFWAIAGSAVVGLALLALVATQVYVILTRPAAPPFRPAVPPELPAAELAERLLGAATPAERAAAVQALGGVELRAAPAVAAALATSLGSAAEDAQLRRNQIAAIDLLARHGGAYPELTDEWLELLRRCDRPPEMMNAALRARALLGDASAADELATAWREALRRRLLLDAVARAGRLDEQPGTRLALHRTQRDLARCAEGLRALGAEEGSTIYDRLVEAYWGSWNWLGQRRGERLADALFDLVRPAESSLQFKPEDVRQPRDVMKTIAARASPATRAAAGLILEQRGPQYKTLCRTIGDTLGVLLNECDATDQQRLAWTIGRLRGQPFGVAVREHPLDITEDQLVLALRWARPSSPVAVKRPYPQPPALAYRAITTARLLERDLLAEMRRGWAEARRALDRWQAGGLGATPRVHELLHPGQRRPNYPALAAALVIIADSGDESVRQQLELWREAADQPAWVRALAYTVLGSLDARRGRWDSGWPAGLDLGGPQPLDSGMPGWDAFGRVLAAGGPSMLERLRSTGSASLTPDAIAKLLEAARAAAARTAPA